MTRAARCVARYYAAGRDDGAWQVFVMELDGMCHLVAPVEYERDAALDVANRLNCEAPYRSGGAPCNDWHRCGNGTPVADAPCHTCGEPFGRGWYRWVETGVSELQCDTCADAGRLDRTPDL